jgi:hypothetical protein
MNVAVPERRMKTACTRAGSYRLRTPCLAAFGLLMLLCLFAPHASAQGCAMCYQNAASSGAQGRLALRHGILILLLPALSLFLGILVLIYSRRDPA